MEPKLDRVQDGNEISPNKAIENTEKVPMKVTDEREPSDTAFSIEKFLAVIERLRTEDLFKMSREFDRSEYGKYMSMFASSESDHWDEAIKNAKAIEITLTTPPNRGHDFLKGRTDVEVKVLMNEKEGRIFNFHFKDGKYHQGGWKDVNFQKMLGGSGALEDFSLTLKDKKQELE